MQSKPGKGKTLTEHGAMVTLCGVLESFQRIGTGRFLTMDEFQLPGLTCPTRLLCEIQEKKVTFLGLFSSVNNLHNLTWQPWKITFSPLSCLSTCPKLFVVLAREAHLELCSWLMSWLCPLSWWLLRPECLCNIKPHRAPHTATLLQH